MNVEGNGSGEQHPFPKFRVSSFEFRVSMLLPLIAAWTALAAPAAHATNEPAAAPATSTGAYTYAYAAGHFSFLVPDYWTLVPEQELEKYRQVLRAATPGAPEPQYVLALQRKALFHFSMPYVLIELERRPMPSADELRLQAAKFDMGVAQQYLPLHRAGVFGEVTAQPGMYDEARHMVIGYYQMRRTSDAKRISAVAAVFACADGVVKFHCFMPAEEQDKHFPVIQRILDSVAFEPAHAWPSVPVQKPFRIPHQLYYVLLPLAGVWLVVSMFFRARSTDRQPRSRFDRR